MPRRDHYRRSPWLGVALIALAAIVAAGAVYWATRPNKVDALAGSTPGYSAPPLAAGTSTSAAPVPKLAVKLPSTGTFTVDFAGDSLTSGFYASTEAQQYRFLLLAALQKRSKAHVVGQLAAKKDYQALATAANVKSIPGPADLVIVQLGTNDQYAKAVGPFADAYSHDLAMAKATGGKLLCLGVWGKLTNPMLVQDNDVIANDCQHAGGVFVPITQLFNDHGPAGRHTFFGTSDDFHPNDAGHAAIAQAVLAQMAIS